MLHFVKTKAERLKWLIEQKGWSRSEASKAAHLARSHAGLIINGKITEPEPETLDAYARALGARPQWLREGEGEPWATANAEAHGSLLDALTTAFRRHETATLADLAAVQQLVEGGVARDIPPEHAADAFGTWLTAAQVTRGRGATFDHAALTAYLSNPSQSLGAGPSPPRRD